MRLYREERLRGSEAAERVGRERVGGDTHSLEIGRGEVIDAICMEHAALQNHVGRGEIRAAVVIDRPFDAEDAPFLIQGRAERYLRRMALYRVKHILSPVEDQLYRLMYHALCNEKRSAEDIREVFLASERSAGGDLPDDYVLGIEAQ